MTELQKILQLTQKLYSLLLTAAEIAGRRGTSLQIDGAALLHSIEDMIELVQQDMLSLTLQMRQYEELVRTTALITSTQSLSEVLESVTDTILKLTHAERTYLMVLDQDTQQLQIQIARNWDQALIPDHEVRFSQNVVRLALERKTSILTMNALEEPHLQMIESVRNYGLLSILCIPLMVRDAVIGVLYADSRLQHQYFSPESEPLFVAFANQAAISIENARLFDRLRDHAIQLNQSREHVITTREEERRRLSRDLHDSLGPMLASLTLTIDAARIHMKQGTIDLSESLLTDAKTTIQTLLGEVRRIVYGLRPPILDELGLVEGIRVYLLSLTVPDQRSMILSIETRLENLSAALEVTLYRLVTEAVTNVVRHASASRCEVRFYRDDNNLCVQVADNGAGLPPNVSVGVGLRSMKERASELGGTCEIASEKGQGVTITARFPI